VKLSLVIAAMFVAGPAVPETVATDADVASLVAAIEFRGCVLGSSNDPDLLADANLSQEQMFAAVQVLMETGQAAVVYDQLHLLTDKCPALDDTAIAASKPDRARFITVVEVNGCKLSKDESNVLLPKAGFTPEIAGPIIEGLIADGFAVFDETEFTLKTGKCH
jgi:hypothetical protein